MPSSRHYLNTRNVSFHWMATSVSDFIKNTAVMRKLVISYSKGLFLVCLQVIFAPCTNRAEILLLFLLHSQYIVQRAGGCSPPCTINTSCHLRIDSVCICVTETAESIWWLHFPDDFIKYGVKTQSFNFICWFAMDMFLAFGERKFFVVRDCHTHCKT